jgi:hypothetical protein
LVHVTPSQVQFGGEHQCIDRSTGDLCRVRVWGVFVGVGIDPHEVQPIQDWIRQALFQLLGNFQGSLQELPRLVHRWAEAVDVQLAPAILQQFEARGNVQIHGVEVKVERPGRGPVAGPPGGSIPTSIAFTGGAAFAARLAQALVANAGLTPQQAQQAVAVTFSVMQAEGLALPGGPTR